MYRPANKFRYESTESVREDKAVPANVMRKAAGVQPLVTLCASGATSEGMLHILAEPRRSWRRATPMTRVARVPVVDTPNSDSASAGERRCREGSRRAAQKRE